jgi:hypothetical protein
MGKKLQNKAETLTIRVTEETRERAEFMYKQAGTSSTFASFLGDMVNLGIKTREKIEEYTNIAIEKAAQDETGDYGMEKEQDSKRHGGNPSEKPA